MRYLPFVVVLALALNSPALAGGLFGDAINVIAPGVGTELDKRHKEFKEQVPIYGQTEETISGGVRQVINETVVESTWPAMAAAVNASRGDALNQGVDNIPQNMQQALSVYFPADILQYVKYRIGGGGDLSLQVNAFRYGDRAAITLYDVIVFRDNAGANNLKLWAHELGHVMQFKEWGLNDFSKRYIRNTQTVEDQAEARANEFVARYNTAATAAPPQPMPGMQQQSSNICRVPSLNNFCVMPVYGPPGIQCWCPYGYSQVNGFVSLN